MLLYTFPDANTINKVKLNHHYSKKKNKWAITSIFVTRRKLFQTPDKIKSYLYSLTVVIVLIIFSNKECLLFS